MFLMEALPALVHLRRSESCVGADFIQCGAAAQRRKEPIGFVAESDVVWTHGFSVTVGAVVVSMAIESLTDRGCGAAQ